LGFHVKEEKHAKKRSRLLIKCPWLPKSDIFTQTKEKKIGAKGRKRRQGEGR